MVEYLDNIYANTLATKKADSTRGNITYNVNILELFEADSEMQQKTINELSRLKRNCFAAVFNVHFQAHINKTGVTETMIPFREEENMYIKSKNDNVVVVFSTIFKDPDDQVLAKVFLSEFADCRINMRTGINAPQVRYDSPNNPPNEIASHPNLLKGDNVHYMTIVLQNAHIEPAHKGENSIDLIHTFRTYLHYHIKERGFWGSWSLEKNLVQNS